MKLIVLQENYKGNFIGAKGSIIRIPDEQANRAIAKGYVERFLTDAELEAERAEKQKKSEELKSRIKDFPKVSFNIATVERRRDSFLKVLKNLAKQTIQCDVINVAMSYNSCDVEINEFIRNNFKATRIVYGQFSCEKKLFAFDVFDGYMLTFDDDIEYPSDYALKMIEGIEKYNRKSIVGFHGMRFDRFPVTNYNTQRKLHQYFADVKEDMPVDIIGSGAMGLHTSTLKEKGFTFYIMLNSSNVTDDVLSRFCRDNKIPMVCLKHTAGWCKSIPNSQDNQAGWVIAANNGNVEQLKYLQC